MSALLFQGRIHMTDVIVTAPDLLLGVLFAIAFVKTSASPVLAARQSRTA